MTEDDFKKMFGGAPDEEKIALDLVTSTLAGFYKAFRKQKLGVIEAAVLAVTVVNISGMTNNVMEQENEDGEDLS